MATDIEAYTSSLKGISHKRKSRKRPDLVLRLVNTTVSYKKNRLECHMYILKSGGLLSRELRQVSNQGRNLVGTPVDMR